MAYNNGFYKVSYWIYRPLAELGSSPYETAVGLMYLTGKGVPKDDDEAAKWLSRSADAGETRAQLGLGLIAAARQDSGNAFNWYLKAAQGGNRRAASLLWGFYLHGWATAADKVEAYRWFLIATGGAIQESRIGIYRKIIFDTAPVPVEQTGGTIPQPQRDELRKWFSGMTSSEIDQAESLVRSFCGRLRIQPGSIPRRDRSCR